MNMLWAVVGCSAAQVLVVSRRRSDSLSCGTLDIPSSVDDAAFPFACASGDISPPEVSRLELAWASRFFQVRMSENGSEVATSTEAYTKGHRRMTGFIR